MKQFVACGNSGELYQLTATDSDDAVNLYVETTGERSVLRVVELTQQSRKRAARKLGLVAAPELPPEQSQESPAHRAQVAEQSP